MTEAHKYANLFPMMTSEELAQLCDDMRASGYDHSSPIVLYNGLILDGRNRQLAADTVGLAPSYTTFTGDDQAALDFVIRHNLKRRHLNETQRALVAGRLANISFGEYVGNQHEGYANLHTPKVSQSAAATMLNVSPRTVATVKAVTKAAPELVERMERGEMTANEAMIQTKRKQVSDAIGLKSAGTLPSNKYRVIYADPPWSYGNKMPEYVTTPEDYYPSMSTNEIAALPIKEMAEDDAVLFMWTTSPHLEESFQVISAWGFKYKSSFVWDKVKHNMGHYNSVRHEFLLVCTRGSCQPDVQRLFDSVLTEERTEHSVKPEAFRTIIDTIYPLGRRIELFARRPVGGWEVWGNEC